MKSFFRTHIFAFATILLLSGPFMLHAQAPVDGNGNFLNTGAYNGTYDTVCGSAQTNITQFKDFVCIVVDLIQVLIPVIFGLALLAFFWGLAKFILHAGDEAAREEGKHIMIWGIVGFFVASSVWAIVQFLYGGIGLGGTMSFPPTLPHF